jgi:hypothetical protein
MISATVAAANSGIAVSIESSGIVGVGLEVGVNAVGVA